MKSARAVTNTREIHNSLSVWICRNWNWLNSFIYLQACVYVGFDLWFTKPALCLSFFLMQQITCVTDRARCLDLSGKNMNSPLFYVMLIPAQRLNHFTWCGLSFIRFGIQVLLMFSLGHFWRHQSDTRKLRSCPTRSSWDMFFCICKDNSGGRR